MTTTRTAQPLRNAFIGYAARYANNHSARDSKGRFVKVVSVDEMNTTGGWVNDANGVSHSSERCSDRRGAEFTVDAEAFGWLCCSCVSVPVSVWVASHNVAGTCGHQACKGCGVVKGMTAFPTVLETGVRTRGTTCRKCQKVARAAARMAG